MPASVDTTPLLLVAKIGVPSSSYPTTTFLPLAASSLTECNFCLAQILASLFSLADSGENWLSYPRKISSIERSISGLNFIIIARNTIAITKNIILPVTISDTTNIIRSKKILRIVTLIVATRNIPSKPLPIDTAFLFVVRIKMPAIGIASTPNKILILAIATLNAYLAKQYAIKPNVAINSNILTIPNPIDGLANDSTMLVILDFTSSFPLLYKTCK